MKRVLLIILIAIICDLTVANAAPNQVVIIRHGDKWVDMPGKVLSPKGYLRAVKFAEYYIAKFKTVPDFLFASNASNNKASLRPIQTLAPLAGHKALIAKKVKIDHTYTKGEELRLVRKIVNDDQYNNKNLVICWQHEKIGDILGYFGFQGKVVWDKYNYDTVYVLNFKDGKLFETIRLDNQYPTPDITSWDYFLEHK